MLRLNQSKISIMFCQPIRREYYLNMAEMILDPEGCEITEWTNKSLVVCVNFLMMFQFSCGGTFERTSVALEYVLLVLLCLGLSTNQRLVLF